MTHLNITNDVAIGYVYTVNLGFKRVAIIAKPAWDRFFLLMCQQTGTSHIYAYFWTYICIMVEMWQQLLVFVGCAGIIEWEIQELPP